jgi:SOS-response transcriptional repressor LexA
MAFARGIDHLDGDQIHFADTVVPHPNSSFLFRVRGADLQDVGILEGDIIVVDRIERLRSNAIALVSEDGALRLVRRENGRLLGVYEHGAAVVELLGVASRVVRFLAP